jgi:hypothetical protein
LQCSQRLESRRTRTGPEEHDVESIDEPSIEERPGQEVLEWRPVFAPSKDGDSERRVSQEPGEWEATLAWEAALAEAAAKATESELELDRGPAQERVAAPS